MGSQDAIAKAMVRIRGSYALALLFKDHPGEIWASPGKICVNDMF